MVYTLDFGLFPFAGVLIGGCLYAIYYWGLRLRCQARWSQTFIVVAMVLTTVSMFVSPARQVQQTTLTSISSNLQVDEKGDVVFQPAKTYDMEEYETEAPVETSITEEAQGDENYGILFTDAQRLMGWLYLIGLMVMLLYFAAQVAFLLLLRGQHEFVGKQGEEHVDVYQIPATHLPFSFGHSIFIPAALDDKTERYVLMHEMAHVRHRHYLWLCLLEVLLVLNWFNPFMWLLFREMHLQQELEVDADMIDEGVDREEYQLSLVSMATRQGKWILTQSAFFGEPLKKRLLFMNTPINWQNACIRLAAALLFVCVVLTAVAGVSSQLRRHDLLIKHPFQGCWAFEDITSNIPDDYDYKPWPNDKLYKFVGDYGDLTFICRERYGNDMYFIIEAMEHRLRGDTLVDVYGRPITYKLTGDQLKWRNFQPGKEGYMKRKDQEETWRRIVSDPQLKELFRAVTHPEQSMSDSRKLNGVWHLDSVTRSHPQYKPTPAVYTRIRKFLIINEPYYMRIEYKPTINEQIMNFNARGQFGEIYDTSDGGIRMNNRYYRTDYQHDDKGTFFTIKMATDYDVDSLEVVRQYYHRVPMPPYIRRMFRPALMEE